MRTPTPAGGMWRASAKGSIHARFTGALPFGPRFGDSKEVLIAKFGPPDAEATDVGPMIRWDTAHYALFAELSKEDTMWRLSIQRRWSRRTGRV